MSCYTSKRWPIILMIFTYQCVLAPGTYAAPSSTCPNGFTYSMTTKSCYNILPQLQSWDNAGQTCRKLSTNAHLLVINDQKEQDEVMSTIKQTLTVSQQHVCGAAWGYWTSGQRNDTTKNATFVWKPFPTIKPVRTITYFHWNKGQPDYKSNSEFCLHMLAHNDFPWNDVSCDRPLCAVCEVDDSDQSTSGTGVLCPTDFTYMAATNKCYFVITQNMTWDEAGQQCQRVDSRAHLVTTRDSVEQNTIESFISTCVSKQQNCNSSIGYWMSGQRVTPLTNTPFIWKLRAENQFPFTYTNWCAGEPNNFGGVESCLMMFTGTYKWNDVACTFRIYALCEVENQ